MVQSFKVNYFFVFTDETIKQTERKKIIRDYVEKLISSKLVNRKYSIDVENKIHYNTKLKITEGFDPKGTWEISFYTDIPDEADGGQLIAAFHELVLDSLGEYKDKLQIGGGSEMLKEPKTLTNEEIKANKLTKEQRKELNRKYYNKKPMKEFIKNMENMFDDRFKNGNIKLDKSQAYLDL